MLGSVLGLGVFVAALRAGLRPYRHPGLSPVVLVTYALVGTLVGAAVWAVVRRRARRPRVVLRRGVAVLAVVVLAADLVVGATSGWVGAALVLAHHLVVTVLAVVVLRRVLLVGEVGTEVREVPWRERLPRVARFGLAAGLAVLAGIWVLVNKPVEGPTLLVLSPSHGVTFADLLSLVALGVAVDLVSVRR
ncbi:hypothetical protein [Actinomycetospora atypica]|uniref:Uncharacterized protein n=1 Tax=Actinomycetospora atypica TaxID=1290095 RepID=A0ABV9YNY0_9PSEU